jgi:serine/threonine-protein kinase
VSRERFRREAQAAASLVHPNIVAVFDLGTDGDVPFIVMELVEGSGLDEIIWREAPLAAGRALRTADGVAAALAHAHAAGIVHRDVKPGNVVVGADGSVRVLDFGIARAAAWTPLTQNQAIQGTPHYVAPELVRGRPADARSDIYSLGAVLYEMLCGRPPFTGDSALAIADRHVREEPVPIGQWNRGLPPGVEAIVMKCLAKDPQRRYQGADDLRGDLRSTLGEPVAPTNGGRPAGVTPTPATIPLPTSSPIPPPPRRDTPPLPAAARGPSPSTSGRRRKPRRLLRAAAVALVAAVLAGSLWLLWSLNGASQAGDGSSRDSSPATIEPLLAPTGIRTEAVCDGFLSTVVTVRWKATTSHLAEGYEVFRSTSASGPFRSVAFVIGRAATRYVDSEVGSGDTYYYVLKSSGGGKTSAYSTLARADTPALCLFP